MVSDRICSYCKKSMYASDHKEVTSEGVEEYMHLKCVDLFKRENFSVMEEREDATGNKWEDKGDGYSVLQGSFHAKVIYISIPKNHKLVGSNWDDIGANVNGGITFARENVFGWDYGHWQNSQDYEGDISRAIEYFESNSDVKEKEGEQ